MRRRQFLKGLLAGGGILLTACGAPAPTPTTGPTPTPAPAQPGATPTPATAKPGAQAGAKIVFMSDIGGEHIKLRDQWAKRFSEQTGIQVEHQPVVQNYNDKLLTMFAGGVPPDVFRYLQELIPIVAAVDKRLLYRLDDFLKRDNYDLSDFLPQAIDLYRWKGTLYALPRDYGNQNIFYNVTLLEKAGIGRLPTDWTDTTFTFERFLEIARALTKSERGRVTQWGCAVNRAWRPWASWVYSNGGAVVKTDADGLATEIALHEPPAVEALQFLQDLIYKHKVAPSPELETDAPARELFNTGRLAMVIDNPSAVQFFRQIKAFEWDVAPFPLGKASRRGVGGGGTGWAIAGPTKQPDAAWEFLKFISSREAQLDEVKIGGTTPSRRSVVNSPEFLDPTKPPRNARGFAQAQEYVVRDPVHARWTEILQQVITRELDALWGNKAPASAVAQEIKKKADPLFKG